MLERDGDEVVRATSIVCYAAGSRFTRHVHELGEELFMLYGEFRTEHTALVRWALATYFNPHRYYGGEEILVVEGVFEDEHGRNPAGSWIRSPHLGQHQPFSREGCIILVKTGHLVTEAEVAP